MKEKQKKDNDKKTRKKNGEGTFRKKGNKWEGRISVKINGKSVQKSVSGNTEREARDKAKLLKKFYKEKEEKYEGVAGSDCYCRPYSGGGVWLQD